MVSVIAMFCCMHLKAGVQSSYDFHNARSCVSSCRAHFIASFFFFSLPHCSLKSSSLLLSVSL